MNPDYTAIIFVVSVVVLIGFIAFLRFMRARSLYAALREAIASNSDATPALLDSIASLDRNRDPQGRDDRTGMILIAFALALAGFGTLVSFGDGDDMRAFFGAALFPLLIGGVLLWRHRNLKRELAGETASVPAHGE